MPHCEEVPVPEFSDLPDESMEYDECHQEVESSASDSGENVFENSSSIPEQFLSGISTYSKKQQKFWHPDSKTKITLETELQ